MGVYINGMEMPTSCCNCLLVKLSPTGESLICNYTLSTVPWDERPFDCPLVPVPPHGRLGDLDALKKVLKVKAKNPLNQETTPYSWAFAYECLSDVVGDMPTIIPAKEE